MKKYDSKILILTLYTGENEFEECLKALENQSYRNWEHKVFRNLPNHTAHRKLYQAIMDNSDDYDLFIKIDADMVLRDSDMLQKLVNYANSHPSYEHLVFSVRDWYSNTDIMGMHVFTSKVTWSVCEDRLFVDPGPDLPCNRKLVWGSPSPVADHSPNPSVLEAFMFGIHRALKVVQRDRKYKSVKQSRFQFQLLRTVWKEFLITQDVRRGAVIWAADLIFSSNDSLLEDKSDIKKYKNSIETIKKMDSSEVKFKLKSKWEKGLVLKWRSLLWVNFPGIILWVTTKVARVPSKLKNIDKWLGANE